MATWNEISRDNLAAAGELMRGGRHRSSISRAYFAVYAAVTAILNQNGLKFPGETEGPPHRHVPKLIMKNLGQLSLPQRRLLRQRVKMLQRGRVQADYQPSITIDQQEARDALREAVLSIRRLGVVP